MSADPATDTRPAAVPDAHTVVAVRRLVAVKWRRGRGSPRGEDGGHGGRSERMSEGADVAEAAEEVPRPRRGRGADALGGWCGGKVMVGEGRRDAQALVLLDVERRWPRTIGRADGRRGTHEARRLGGREARGALTKRE